MLRVASGTTTMKSKLSLALAAGCALTLSVGAAKADTISTFDVSATSVSQSFTLGGNIVIDVSNGQVQSEDVTVAGLAGFGPFTFNDGNIPLGPVIQLNMLDPGSNTLALFLPVSHLIGYTGGAICGTVSNTGCGPFFSEIIPQFGIASGSLTAEAVTVTPLPAALPLFATALVGFWAWARRRKEHPGEVA
jgi:hypothetical protein